MSTKAQTLFPYPGNKAKFVYELLPYFREHELFIDLMHGAGGVGYNKPLVKYNYFNDISFDISNLTVVLQSDELFSELKEKIRTCIGSTEYLDFIQNYVSSSERRVESAFNFLYKACFSMYSRGFTFRCGMSNAAKILFHKLDLFRLFYSGYNRKHEVTVLNKDYRDVLGSFSMKNKDKNYDRCLVYADPMYVGTSQDTYKPEKVWNIVDCETMVKYLKENKFPFAISETDNKAVKELMSDYKLNCYEIATVKHMGKKTVKEMLYTNYVVNQNENIGLWR